MAGIQGSAQDEGDAREIHEVNPVQFQLGSGAGVKLTNWKREPTIQDLKQDLEQSKSAHDAQVSKIKHWNELMQVEGSAKPPKVKGRSSIEPKLIRRQAEWRYSSLSEPFLGSNKLFKVSPVTYEDGEAARQNELVLNWQFRTKLNRVKLIDDFVRSTVDDGTSVLQVGWVRSTVMVDQEVPVYTHYELQDESQAQQLQQALDLKTSNPREYETQVPPELKAAVQYYEEEGQATYALQTGVTRTKVEKVLENRPTVDVLNPANVYIDPSCQGDLSKALFVVVSFETNKAELLKQKSRYKNLDRVNWEAASTVTEGNHESQTDSSFQISDRLRKKVVAYEYWGYYDIEGEGTLSPIVATWIGDVLIRMEANPFPDEKLPFVVVTYLPVKRDLYGEPDAELLEDNQKILGALARGMIDLLGRSANGQQGFAKGMLDPLNRRRFENGQDYEFNPGMSPANGLIQHKYPELPQSALLMLNLQNQEAEALTGVKSFSGGLSGQAYGNVATGIRGMLDAASKREMAILRRLAKGITEIGQKIIAMNGEFLSEQEIVRVTNEKFVVVNREDLKGNFDLETDISTVEVDNAKSQDLAFMLQTMGPNSPPDLAFKIMASICDLKRMPELAHELRTYQPQLTPEQQALQQLEIQNKQLENQKLQSEIMLNQARAKQASSQADRTDLDYVEQETGTAHAREIEKQKAQAQGNQQLEVTKALLKSRKLSNGMETKPDIQAAVGFNQVSDRLSEDSRVKPLIPNYGQSIPAFSSGIPPQI